MASSPVSVAGFAALNQMVKSSNLGSSRVKVDGSYKSQFTYYIDKNFQALSNCYHAMLLRVS